MAESRIIDVKAISRVEGEGRLLIRMNAPEIEHVELNIYEPPRFFEAFLRGREIREVPDITARICGICPVAYQMSACHALEKALGLNIPPSIRTLRRLLYCGEWIESHALHIHLLHAPDFLGFESGISMAARHKGEVERGLKLKKYRQSDRRNCRRPGGASYQCHRGRLLPCPRIYRDEEIADRTRMGIGRCRGYASLASDLGLPGVAGSTTNL